MHDTATSFEKQLDMTPTQPAEDALWATLASLQLQNVDPEVIGLALAKVFITYARSVRERYRGKRQAGWFVNLTDNIGWSCRRLAEKMRVGWPRDLFNAMADTAEEFREKHWPTGDAWRQMYFKKILSEREPRGEC